MEFEILCIFTQTGHTFTFKSGDIICDNETMLVFNYKAMSDGKIKTATFPKANIAGWSITIGG